MSLARASMLLRRERLAQYFTIPDKSNPLHLPQVRHRKPRWLFPQRAPSKQGIYFHHPKPSENDMKKGELMYKSYNSLLKSIVAAFQEEILLSEEIGVVTSEVQDTWNEEEHHAKCMEYNDMINAELSKVRSEKLRELKNAQMSAKILHIEQLEEQMNIRLAKFEKEVLETLDESKDWVNLQNMEERINKALDNAVNFNFAVRNDGYISTRSVVQTNRILK